MKNIMHGKDIFKNVEKFEHFLKDNLKIYYDDLLEYHLDALNRGNSEIGNLSYELNWNKTKNKCPISINFQVEYGEDTDYDSYYKIITF